LKRAPFRSIRVSGGGSFIDEEEEKGVEEWQKNKEEMIQCVENLLVAQ